MLWLTVFGKFYKDGSQSQFLLQPTLSLDFDSHDGSVIFVCMVLEIESLPFAIMSPILQS